jgi:molybdopterin adenylyltransferase
MSGAVAFVCVSERRGIPKHPVARARLLADHGIEGDSHAGNWHRQVSLLAETDIDQMRATGLTLDPGAFGENLVVRGVDLGDLGIGSRLAIGGAEIAVTQVGKVCHNRCAIYVRSGDCVMPRSGLFARVVRGAEVAPGAPVEVVEAVAHDVVQVGVVTISDRCAAGAARDTAGPAVSELLHERLGARPAWSGVLPDREEGIVARLTDLAERGLALVVTVGGTGLAASDVTPEATRRVIGREVPGLAEAMRAASAAITPAAWLSRAVCGARGRTLIVNLPGSRKAALENLAAILPALPHALELLRGETAHRAADEGRDVAPGEVPEVCP